jgi:hypothetical protein
MDIVKYFQEGITCVSCQKEEYNSFFDNKTCLEKCPSHKPCQEEWDMMVEIVNYHHFDIGDRKKKKESLDVQQSSHEHLSDIVEFPFPAFLQRFGWFDHLRLLRWLWRACKMFSSELELNWPSKLEQDSPSPGVSTDSWISWVAGGWPCQSIVIVHWIWTRPRSIYKLFFHS